MIDFHEPSKISIKLLFLLNDVAYGTERSYSAVRLARSLFESGDEEVKVFLLSDAVACAKRGHLDPVDVALPEESPAGTWCFYHPAADVAPEADD